MKPVKTLSAKEIHKLITWVESEIDRCIENDLPMEHIEKQLITLNDMLKNQVCSKMFNFRGGKAFHI